MIINSHINNNQRHTTSKSNNDLSEKMQRCQDYIHALEEERLKIQVFQRELPLCLELVTQAIEACKQQLSGTSSEYNINGGQSECSEQTSREMPPPAAAAAVNFEEFFPINKRDSNATDDDNEEQILLSKKPKNYNTNNNHINATTSSTNKDVKIHPTTTDNINNNNNPKKSDWLRSVQLWNQSSDPPSKEKSPRKVAVMEVNRNGSGGAFHPFKKEKIVAQSDPNTAVGPTQGPVDRSVTPASTSSTAENGASSSGAAVRNNKEEKDGQSQRKARRCWSPELHKRFLQALQQLGGSHVATPKQIRDLMKVDGLTNDEVKSHLQKYRLHTRRPSPSMHNNNTTTAQAPQFVVVGGIWVPPEYATMAATATTAKETSGVAHTNGIYAPIATLPPPFQRAAPSSKQSPSSSNDKGSHSEAGGGPTHSPAASSSSTHTTTASPAY